MKTIKLLLIALATCSLTACSDDDDSNNNNNKTAGTYLLTSVTVQSPVDLNLDGTGSTNLMDESTCYINSKIVLDKDRTYTLDYNSVLFESETGCYGEQASGTWKIEDNKLILTNTYIEPSLATEYDIDNNIVVRTLTNSQYPDRDEEGNEVYTNGTVQLIFTKQNNTQPN